MLRETLFLCMLATVFCQYPRQRAPRINQTPPPEEYADYEDYTPPRRATPVRQTPPQTTQGRKVSDILRPASVHYVNIGPELAGDYKFGYDTGKGEDGQSFREETRLSDGSVEGEYGYVDETGTQRIVRYIAGRNGFKVLKDGETAEEARKTTPAPRPEYQPPKQAYLPRSQLAARAPQAPYKPPSQAQPVNRAPPQSQRSYRAPPQPQPAYRAPLPPQPAHRAPTQPQPADRTPPQPQPADRAPPQPQPAYRAPPQTAHAPQQPTRSQTPRQQYSSTDEDSYNDFGEYDYPYNEISVRRLVPVDTSLFNYNIGTTLKTNI